MLMTRYGPVDRWVSHSVRKKCYPGVSFYLIIIRITTIPQLTREESLVLKKGNRCGETGTAYRDDNTVDLVAGVAVGRPLSETSSSSNEEPQLFPSGSSSTKSISSSDESQSELMSAT
jgi:hypothetical protein